MSEINLQKELDGCLLYNNIPYVKNSNYEGFLSRSLI